MRESRKDQCGLDLLFGINSVPFVSFVIFSLNKFLYQKIVIDPHQAFICKYEFIQNPASKK